MYFYKIKFEIKAITICQRKSGREKINSGYQVSRETNNLANSCTQNIRAYIMHTHNLSLPLSFFLLHALFF